MLGFQTIYLILIFALSDLLLGSGTGQLPLSLRRLFAGFLEALFELHLLVLFLLVDDAHGLDLGLPLLQVFVVVKHQLALLSH